MMVDDNRASRSTAFTISLEARKGVTTGISAADRAHTILTAVANGAGPADLVSPGHVFPLKAVAGGGPMHTLSSASRTCMASASAVECTATVWMPISRQAR